MQVMGPSPDSSITFVERRRGFGGSTDSGNVSATRTSCFDRFEGDYVDLAPNLLERRIRQPVFGRDCVR
jgi:hypothetical protein